MKELYPADLTPGTFRMGPDGFVYHVPRQRQSAVRMTMGLRSQSSPFAVAVTDEMKIRGIVQDRLEHLPQMGQGGPC